MGATLVGWSLFTTAGADVTSYRTGTGSVNNGAIYSFGAAASTERALGGVGSSAFSGYIAVALKNASGGNYNSLTIKYDGEQWRNGGNITPQTMVLEYGFGSTFATVSSWTQGGASFDFTSLQNTATAAALDGNAAGNRTTGLGGVISSTWNSGDTLWIRWIENNDSGNDHGLAIDDFLISADAIPAVPEASTWYAGIGLSLGMLVSFVRKIRK